MQRRSLGSSGLDVPVFGLGCMGMSEHYGPTDEHRALETLALALDLGIDWLDTADVYGRGANESLIGRFLAEDSGRRDRVVLATKAGIVRHPDGGRHIDNSPAYLRRCLEASLTRLKVDAVDLFYIHRLNPETPIEEAVGGLADLVAEGKTRAIGLSEPSAETLRRAHAVHPVAAVQSEYSLWTRDPEAEILPLCADLGVTFVAYSPLGRGFLAGSATDRGALAADDFRRANPRFQDDALTRNRALHDALAAFAAARDATPAQIALAWLAAKHGHVTAIPGTTRPDHLRSNAAAADLALSAAEVADLDALFPPGAAAGDRYPPAAMAELGR